ncbi:MAG: hypothetical protein ACOYMA_19330 [Bacteroidia bacterium]
MKYINLNRLTNKDCKLTYKQFEYILILLNQQKDTKNFYVFKQEFQYITYHELSKFLSIKTAVPIISALKLREEIKLKLYS